MSTTHDAAGLRPCRYPAPSEHRATGMIGTTIVFVTHDPRMAEFARRLIHIRDGKLVNGDGKPPNH